MEKEGGERGHTVVGSGSAVFGDGNSAAGAHSTVVAHRSDSRAEPAEVAPESSSESWLVRNATLVKTLAAVVVALAAIVSFVFRDTPASSGQPVRIEQSDAR